jgi:hypothetical protein
LIEADSRSAVQPKLDHVNPIDHGKFGGQRFGQPRNFLKKFPEEMFRSAYASAIPIWIDPAGSAISPGNEDPTTKPHRLPPCGNLNHAVTLNALFAYP